MPYIHHEIAQALAAFTAAAPNHQGIAERINREHPHLLRHNGSAADTEFLQRVLAALPVAEAFGHLSKLDGERGHTFPNGVRVSHDAICHRPTGRQIDIINGSANHPNPGGPAWQEIDPALYRPHNVWTPQQPLFDSGTPGGEAPTTIAELGCGWFCLLRALADWPTDAAADAAWLREHLKPKVWRVFLDVEGILHGDPDPWRDAGVDGRSSTWQDRFQRALDWAGDAGEQLWCCVYGGTRHFPSRDSRRLFHDRIVHAAEGRWGAIWGLEVANEFKVNGWDAPSVREAGRDLRNKIPIGIRLALSSPALAHDYVNGREPTSEEMADSFAELYGEAVSDHAGANVITVHKLRVEGSKWADMFSYNAYLPRLPKIDNEPFGPGASAGGDVNEPGPIVRNYQRSSEAGNILYVPHGAWHVFNGRLPDQYRRPYDVRHVWEQAGGHYLDIAHGLRAYRATGTVIIEPGGEMPAQPYPDEATFWRQEFKNRVKAQYAEKGVPFDDDYPVWFSRTAYDIAAGLTKEASADKHIKELRQALGLPPAA